MCVENPRIYLNLQKKRIGQTDRQTDRQADNDISYSHLGLSCRQRRIVHGIVIGKFSIGKQA